MSRIIQPTTPLDRSISKAPAAPSAPPVSGPSTPSANQYTTSTNYGASAATQGAPSGGLNITPSNPPASAGDRKPGAPDAGVNKGKGGAGAKKPKPKPTPKYQPPPDPRDSTYYANTAALTNMLGQNIGSALLDQKLADNSFAENSERMGTDRARARRNLAESLLGSGGIRSGAHRREQTERDQDYMIDRNRLGYDYGNDTARRNLEIAGYRTDYRDQSKAEYRAASDRYAAKVKAEAETGTGNSAMTPKQKAKANLRKTVKKEQKVEAGRRKAVKRDTKIIENLKERIADADKEQAAKIRQRLTKVRKRRATIVKKINNG